MSSAKFPGLGIDLVEIKKAKTFFKRHASRLDSFFTKSEMRFIFSESNRCENLALLLAAKEAVFKTKGAAWMGPRGFKTIKIATKNGKLACRGLRLNAIKNKKYVIVCAGTS
jgi:phosphopantetheine--protein transferase-like protein